jgi:hypothetical protein
MTTIADITGLSARIAAAMNSGAYDAQKPGSAFTEFAVVRHFVRANDDRLQRVRAELARVRRLAGRLDGSPFNKHRIDQVNDYATTLKELLALTREAQQKLGRIVIDMAQRIDAETTMEQRLEILNCNPADRADLPEPNIGLVELVGVYCVEDSAAHRGDEFNDRPLHAAVNAEIHRVMFDTPEGRAASKPIFDAAFAPGGIFHGLSTYYRQPDGTMKRKAPSLVLHDAAGSRVIERTPS